MIRGSGAAGGSLTTEEQAVLGKAARHLIPLVGLLYVVSFLDRVNVSYAALTMNRPSARLLQRCLMPARVEKSRGGEPAMHVPVE